MLTKKKTALSIIIVCFICVMMAGCNGGSSGGGGGAAAEESAYSGVTSQALLDETNSQQIVEEAYFSGSSTSSLTVPFSFTGGDAFEGECFPILWYLSGFADDLVQQIVMLDDASAPSAMSAIVTEEIDIDDGYGGTISGTVQVDDETGDFSGTITYNNYSIMGIASNGSVTVQGNYNSDTKDITVDMNFTNFTVSYEGVSQTMNGTASFATSGYNVTMIMNIVIGDNNTGKTYWMKDYRIDVVDNYYNEQISVSGSFYDPDYGYVVLSTQGSLVYYYDDDFPSSGIIVATGAQGSAGGNTKAWLTALSSSTYRVEADTDGDGEVDWDSGILNW